MDMYTCTCMAASHLTGYAGVSAKVSGGQNAEGVRSESEWLLVGSRSEPPASEASDEPRSSEQVPLNAAHNTG